MSMQPLQLPAARLKEINTALGQILTTEQELERLERCGYDASNDKAELAFYKDRLTSIKREYFPTAIGKE
jgi:hypothetical protein